MPRCIISIVSGYGEIGGNCVKIMDSNRGLLFDQGIRFSVFRRYFSRLFEPRGIIQLRSIRIIPPLDTYDEVSELYISHFHLDHLGLLHAVPRDIKIYVPSLEILKLMCRHYEKSTTWLAYVPPRYDADIRKAEPIKGRDIVPVQVRHSSYPSFAYIYFGSEKTILYTGDLRVEPLLPKSMDKEIHPITLLDYLEENKDIKIDTLIIEGTNFGRINTPIDGFMAQKMLAKIIDPHKTALLIVDPGDIELLILVLMSLAETKKKPILASKKLVDMTEHWAQHTQLIDTDQICTLAETIEEATTLEIVGEKDVKKHPEKYAILTDLATIDETLHTIGEETPRGAPAILLIPEPLDESSLQNEKTLQNWLQHYHYLTYRIRISGHYHPHQLKRILRTIKPKEIIPIHTTKPKMIKDIHSAYILRIK